MKALTPEQVKGRIKNIAKNKKSDARILIRVYMMERFLERIANSKYVDNFIIKGGILVTSMVGVAMRSTMDIDVTIQNHDLTKKDALEIIHSISIIDLNDGVKFVVKEVSEIMDNMEYPGLRISMNAMMGKAITPVKIDISTGDIITPKAINYEYQLMLEERKIKLWAYNLETILSEKLETIFSRGILNTRMRDFYDIYTLFFLYESSIDKQILKSAFEATCLKRNTILIIKNGDIIIDTICHDINLQKLWNSYQKKYSYASEIEYEDVINSISILFDMIKN